MFASGKFRCPIRSVIGTPLLESISSLIECGSAPVCSDLGQEAARGREALLAAGWSAMALFAVFGSLRLFLLRFLGTGRRLIRVHCILTQD
jgi:hypothetical protein